jgi:hypothetical protein
MRALFLDCNDQLAPVWQRVLRPGDPAIDVNRKAYDRAELPRVLKGYDICIDVGSTGAMRLSMLSFSAPARRAT